LKERAAVAAEYGLDVSDWRVKRLALLLAVHSLTEDQIAHGRSIDIGKLLELDNAIAAVRTAIRTAEPLPPVGNETGRNMDGTPTSSSAEHDRLGRLLPGNTRYRERKRRIEAKAADLATDFDTSSAVTRTLLRVAATHLITAELARSSALRARGTRLALKILSTLPKKPAPPLRRLDTYLAAKAAPND
jgi:hypothetical protein